MRQLQACKAQSSKLQADLGTCQNQIAELQSQMKVSCLLMRTVCRIFEQDQPRVLLKEHGAVNKPKCWHWLSLQAQAETQILAPGRLDTQHAAVLPAGR